MEIINMTPHPVTICDGEGRVLREYPASGAQIRLRSETIREGSLPDGTPLSKTIFGEATGLPEEMVGTLYIVSQLVKSALPNRADLLVPAEVLRDQSGNIVGCQSLGK